MWPHFARLFSRSWTDVLQALSTSTLAIVLFTIFVPGLIWFITMFRPKWIKGKRQKPAVKLRVIFAESVSSATWVTLGVWIVVFGYFLIKRDYNDQNDNIARLNYVTHERDELKVGFTARDSYIKQLEKNQCVPTHPAPTAEENMKAMNGRLTEYERSQFSKALLDFEGTLKNGRALSEEFRLQPSTTPQEDRIALQTLSADRDKWFKQYFSIRKNWGSMFTPQMEYIFSGDGNFSDQLEVAEQEHDRFLEMWRKQSPEDKTSPAYQQCNAYAQKDLWVYVGPFQKWILLSFSRIQEERNSLH